MRQMTVAAMAAIAVLAASAGLAGCASESSSSSAASGTSSSASAAASASAASCSNSAIQSKLYAKGMLTVATDKPVYPPWFVNNTPTNGQGYESAVASAVAAQLGFPKSQVTWAYEPFNSSYAPGPKKFDFVINEISYSAARAQAVRGFGRQQRAQRAHRHVVELAEDRLAAVGHRVERRELVADREEPVQRCGAPLPHQRHAFDRVVRPSSAHPIPVKEHQCHPRLPRQPVVDSYYPHAGGHDPKRTR